MNSIGAGLAELFAEGSGAENPMSLGGEPNRALHKLILSEQLLSIVSPDVSFRTHKRALPATSKDERLLAHELEIARNIQQSLLPRNFPVVPGWSIGGFCQSARQVGGDFYDVLPLGPKKMLLVLADVMGKGVPAALFAATLRTLIRTMVEWTQRPGEILARINRLLFDELTAVDMFITAQVALVDLGKSRLTIANAGHCPLLLTDFHAECSPVSPEGMPLGILPHLAFAEQTLSLKSYRFILLYTDGVTEARNQSREAFGYQRLVQWLQQNVLNTVAAAQLTDDFRSQISSFQDGAPLNDDQTFLLMAAE